jgi:hypothetical protein
MSENPNPEPQPNDGGEPKFTQADVDAEVQKIAAKIRAEERQKVTAKFADYDDLRAKAGEAATAEERIAALEQEIQATQREALRRRVQAAHGIADEDADLFLTGTDEETLTAQAKRLADRESERKSNGNQSPREGNNPRPVDDPVRNFTRGLFGEANV